MSERLFPPSHQSHVSPLSASRGLSDDKLHDLEVLAERVIAQTPSSGQELEQLTEPIVILFQRNSQTIQRASEVWVPDIRKEIEEAKVLSERVLDKLAPIEERATKQLKVYEYEQRRASAASVQLEWHAASWMVKLRKVFLGEVKGKRMKLLRIVAPFVLGFAILLLVGFAGRLLLRWGLLAYYRKF
ncbi:uncharacterized protein EI90DRAFT_3118439 [Cantharellus anzutake]|uniref:uncharacterized protein n=1 Tax=Cantharellus anzutake TaxID=1750568 RepID=UPI001906D200|nr:uncharacterized protein EI90DRAFT_3118439 [Cantharellus anzutake]KAF8337976.1 hypothetical protein EI90DRAFT_3118439 [Cantharellus anzutake]